MCHPLVRYRARHVLLERMPPPMEYNVCCATMASTSTWMDNHLVSTAPQDRLVLPWGAPTRPHVPCAQQDHKAPFLAPHYLRAALHAQWAPRPHLQVQACALPVPQDSLQTYPVQLRVLRVPLQRISPPWVPATRRNAYRAQHTLHPRCLPRHRSNSALRHRVARETTATAKVPFPVRPRAHRVRTAHPASSIIALLARQTHCWAKNLLVVVLHARPVCQLLRLGAQHAHLVLQARLLLIEAHCNAPFVAVELIPHCTMPRNAWRVPLLPRTLLLAPPRLLNAQRPCAHRVTGRLISNVPVRQFAPSARFVLMACELRVPRVPILMF